MHEAFVEHFPDLKLELNPTTPRRGAFELIVTNCNGIGRPIFDRLSFFISQSP